MEIKVELKPYSWEINGELYRSDFFPFVDGIPRKDLASCNNCIFDNGTDECEKTKEIRNKKDDKLYLFCGAICGYFTLKPYPQDLEFRKEK